MDHGQDTTLMEDLAVVPDPRKRRGRRSPGAFLLALSSRALASGQQLGRAMAQGVHEHADERRLLLHPPRDRRPHESTRRRVLRTVDLAALETRLAQFPQPLETRTLASRPRWNASLDGSGVGQVVRRPCRRRIRKPGEGSDAVS
jgi:hypothetical protein